MRSRRPGFEWGFALVLIAIGVAVSLASGWDDTLTVDEVAHLGAGCSYLLTRDMRMNPEHPPLVKLLAGVPLLDLKLNRRAFVSPNWKQGGWGQYDFARQLIYRSGVDPATVTRRAHLGVVPVLVLAGVVLFGWARRLCGEPWAFCVLVLFCFSPTVLAHGKLVTTDVAAAMGVLLSTSAFLFDLRRPNRGRGLSHYEWLEALSPVIVIGHSLNVYRLTSPDALGHGPTARQMDSPIGLDVAPLTPRG